MKIGVGKTLKSVEEIACHNDIVDFIHRAVNAGIITLENTDKLPERYAEPVGVPYCPHCGEKALSKLSVLYYERTYRAFHSFGRMTGVAQIAEWDGGCDLRLDVPREAPLARSFISCATCGEESPMPKDIQYEF